MTGGYIFTLCVSSHLGGGVPTFQVVGGVPTRVWVGGYLPSQVWVGVPTLAGGGYLPWLGGGVPTFPGLDGRGVPTYGTYLW